jgi:hypothetical protein
VLLCLPNGGAKQQSLLNQLEQLIINGIDLDPKSGEP